MGNDMINGTTKPDGHISALTYMCMTGCLHNVIHPNAGEDRREVFKVMLMQRGTSHNTTCFIYLHCKLTRTSIREIEGYIFRRQTRTNQALMRSSLRKAAGLSLALPAVG